MYLQAVITAEEIHFFMYSFEDKPHKDIKSSNLIADI